MKSPYGDQPILDPQWIAAYLDGEMDGNADLAPLRRQIQEWLLDHPEAGAEALAQRRLHLLMKATPAPEPTEAAWERVFTRLVELPAPPLPMRRGNTGRRVALVTAVLSTAAAVWLALLWSQQAPLEENPPLKPAPLPVNIVQEKPVPPPQPREQPTLVKRMVIEPLPVATEEEVEIIRIGGADVKTLVVGNLPVRGPLQIPGPGEVSLTREEPEVHLQEGASIFWMRSAEEDKTP